MAHADADTPDDPTPVLLRAPWVAPIDRPPIPDGAVLIHKGRIARVGPYRDLSHDASGTRRHDAGDSVILPGLVNAHTHLELTHFARTDPPPAGGFVGWILALRERVMAEIANHGGDAAAVFGPSAADGVAQCRRFGVTCVGDIALNPATVRAVLRRERLRAVSYGEVVGMAGRAAQLDPLLAAATDRSLEGDRLRIGIEPHAPYSLDLTGYRRCVEVARESAYPLATHLAETPDEAEFLAHHSGGFRDLWTALGAWSDDVSRFEGGPIRGMQAVGLLDLPHSLLAHVNYCDDAGLDLLARGRASVVYCPRTHAWFRHPPHRWREMMARGINVAVGTDSCASSPDLNLADDLRLAHQLAPDVAPDLLWQLATINAARALGLERDVGSITIGKAADLSIFPTRGDDPLRYVLENPVLPREVWSDGRVTA
ncbi:MAG TPA: amidohydrolase family protein [Gemmataceae bacterium]|nr:amidohydrolase family protein [Gemmataceae bacterium]